MQVCTPGYECFVENIAEIVLFIVENIGDFGVVLIFVCFMFSLLFVFLKV